MKELPNNNNPKFQILKGQIKTWGNRAEMALKHGRDDLVQQALEHKRRYENELAKLQEFETDQT